MAGPGGRRARRVLLHTAEGMAVHDADGSRVTVARREVAAAVRHALAGSATPAGVVEVAVDDGHLVAVTVEVAGPWGVDLHEAARTARAHVLDALVGVVGLDPAFDADRGVRVQVGDVEPPG